MCRWLTYSGAPIYLEKLLFEPENSLIHQSLQARKGRVATNGDGFGIGWYGERDVPGVYHEILPAWNDSNLKSLSHQLQSTLFFAHVRASTGTATSRLNCHPFSHGKWLFMHNGQIGGYDKVRRALDQLIPDALYPYRQGTTDSELMFFLLVPPRRRAQPGARPGADRLRDPSGHARCRRHRALPHDHRAQRRRAHLGRPLRHRRRPALALLARRSRRSDDRLGAARQREQASGTACRRGTSSSPKRASRSRLQKFKVG